MTKWQWLSGNFWITPRTLLKCVFCKDKTLLTSDICNLFTYINSSGYTAISLLTSFLTLHTHMSSIGHLVLYLVDPVSDDTTSGLEHITKTQRDLLPNHSIFGSESTTQPSQSHPPIRSEQFVLVSGRDRYTMIGHMVMWSISETWLGGRQWNEWTLVTSSAFYSNAV